ncbi:MAG: AI-2E family transporter [Hyphomicrobiales bacterium]|nr:AI-2E family transporter [Hyphomicrobiales bacterium]
MARETSDDRVVIRAVDIVTAVLIVAAIAILLLVLWRLSHVIMLVFGAILVAVMLRSLSEPIERYTPIPNPWSLFLAVLVVAVFIAGFVVLLGTQIDSQIRGLIIQLPALWDALEAQLGLEELGETLAERVRDFLFRGETVANFAGLTLGLVDIVLSAALVLVAGIYIAARPISYRSGFLTLFPRGARERIAKASDSSWNALRYWLAGQLVAMVIIGILSTIGLSLIGVPSALALGFIAGISDFVPIVGPIFGAIPAILVGFKESPTHALWVIALYLVIQQVEGNIVMPLVQRRAVDLPPAVALFALVAFGVLFGPLGVVFATPLAVVALVTIKQLYVRDTLGEDVGVPGDRSRKPDGSD